MTSRSSSRHVGERRLRAPLRSSLSATSISGERSGAEPRRRSSRSASTRSSASASGSSATAERRPRRTRPTTAARGSAGARPLGAGRPCDCARSCAARPRATRSVGSNVSARFQSARNVSCTTSSASPRSEVSRLADGEDRIGVTVIERGQGIVRPAATSRTRRAASSPGPGPVPVIRYVPRVRTGFERPCSPRARLASCDGGQGAGGEMRLQADDAAPTDDRVVGRGRRELEPIALRQLGRTCRRART